MAHEVVRVVTQPYHDADDKVLYSPGDRVPYDADLPYGVRTTLAVAEVADKPEPEPADPAPARGTAKAAASARA